MQQMTKMLMYGSIYFETGKKKRIKNGEGGKRGFRQREKN